ncbi:hypothetical protein GOB94_13095 [Granulicella sp. 5B5]|uniref:hypothetical protein n=1 Tax=Granulicella sp. 5B5 TaxID=1617967 RepID=UPI0015F763B0|nr:hypothetical protein [Granulicella sp. 5B5]QMV19518.1 hypothetical protein GOB94_13095 [Granulicella sp. 5B5]
MNGVRGVVMGVAIVLSAAAGHAQFKVKNEKAEQRSKFKNPPTLQTSIDTRDAFIDRIGEDGFYCRLPAPAVVVADTPLFGEYEKNTDNLVTPDWMQLKPDEKAIFAELAGPGATDAQAKDVFDMEAHHWILIVETVRWWEACKELTLKLTPYQAEVQAARVALAYWRELDPDVVTKLTAIREALDKEPSPVPAGQDFPTYFNQHYQRPASGKEYLWMQAQVVGVVMAEKPEPTVVEALKRLE